MTNVTASASGGTDNNGVYNLGPYPLTTLTNVTASASGGDNTRGVQNVNSMPTMTNVIASASGGSSTNVGVANEASSPTMTNVTASASGATGHGVYSFSSGTIRINHSVIKGTWATVYNGSGVTTRVGATQLDGGQVINSGTLTCVGAYDENYGALTANCQ